ncbi:hypothetical protein RRG08_016512 [Elysia crispata]|uniref:Uncharacterized protein n=1 Tax=Elysia crispata TaxID=231223 RepID=A0AAE0YAK6_9GAST|nr:hypothetical protein RRG08_016512 [Elysia crispata]
MRKGNEVLEISKRSPWLTFSNIDRCRNITLLDLYSYDNPPGIHPAHLGIVTIKVRSGQQQLVDMRARGQVITLRHTQITLRLPEYPLTSNNTSLRPGPGTKQGA